MPIATAPALLLGLGARILLDHFSRIEGPSVKDFILVGAWQGVALHYAIKTSGFGIIVAFGIAAKLFIEFNLVLDVTRSVTTVVGIALGVLFTDFLSQYFDKPLSSDRKRKKHQSSSTPIKPEIRRERVVQFRPSVQGGSLETLIGPTSNPFMLSDITSIDSLSDTLASGPSLSPLEREVHALRTRASLADSERRRCKEERKWAVSQGNIARASQMKWEAKRYTALMQDFNREADLKAMEGWLVLGVCFYMSNGLMVIASVSNNSYLQNDKEDQRQIASGSKEKAIRSYRDSPVIDQTNGHAEHKTNHLKRSSTKRNSPRVANG